MVKVNFYCMGCKQKVQSEILEIREKNGKRYAGGECSTCGSNLSVVIPNNLKIDSNHSQERQNQVRSNYLQDFRSESGTEDDMSESGPIGQNSPDTLEMIKLKKQIAESERKLSEETNKLREREKVENYIEKANENDLLKEYDILTVKRKWYNFWKVLGILGFLYLLVMAGLLIFTGYELYKHNDFFKSLVSPVFNNNPTNNYDFNPSTTNSYQHNIDARDYNNITIKNEIKICGNETC